MVLNKSKPSDQIESKYRHSGDIHNYVGVKINKDVVDSDILSFSTEDERYGFESFAQASPSVCYKSTFAKEVAQNVRKCQSMIHMPYIQPLTHKSVDEFVDDSGTSMDTGVELEETVIQNDLGDKGNETISSEADFWMTSTEFEDLLNEKEKEIVEEPIIHEMSSKQINLITDVKDDRAVSCLNRKKLQNIDKIRPTKSRIRFSNRIVKNFDCSNFIDTKMKNEHSSFSFLDEDANIPIHILKKTCQELGMHYTEEEWKELIVSRVGHHHVQNADFFNAIKNLQERKHHRPNLFRYDDAIKYSMKSDSGGEMESCRSSDSDVGRESDYLMEKTNFNAMRLVTELNESYDDIADREMILMKFRMECKRLMEINKRLSASNSDLSKEVSKSSNLNVNEVSKTPYVDALEKEVDHLKWQLKTVENCRKTYELATQRLSSFFDEVSFALQDTGTTVRQRKFIESAKAEVSAVVNLKKTSYQKRYSLDSGLGPISRTTSMPGLLLESNINESKFSLSSRSVKNSSSSSSTSSTSSSVKSGRNSISRSAKNLYGERRRNIKRSHSVHTAKVFPLPSLSEQDHVSEQITSSELCQTFINNERISTNEVDNNKDVTLSECSKVIQTVSSAEDQELKDENSLALISSPKPPLFPRNMSQRSINPSKPRKKEIIEPVSEDDTLTRSSRNSSISNIRNINGGHRRQASINSLSICGSCVQHDEIITLDDIAKLTKRRGHHKIVRCLRNMLTREKTLTITPKKNKQQKNSVDNDEKTANLRLLSHTSFPGMPTYAHLAAANSSPWQC